MKKTVALILALIMVLALCAGCGSSGEDRLKQIKEKGVIEIATEPYFAPYEFIDPSKDGDEQFVGMDMEFAKAIAEKLGVELKIVPLDFTAVLAGVAEGKYDMAISAIAYSPSRAETMTLSKGYLITEANEYGFLTRAEDVDKYDSIESLKDAVVITQSGSVQEGIYNEQVKNCKEFKRVDNMTDGYLAVAEGRADVCIVSKASASLYAEANGGLAIPEFRFETDPLLDSVVVAMPKSGCDELCKEVNAVIDELAKDDQFKDWFAQYGEYATTLGIE